MTQEASAAGGRGGNISGDPRFRKPGILRTLASVAATPVEAVLLPVLPGLESLAVCYSPAAITATALVGDPAAAPPRADPAPAGCPAPWIVSPLAVAIHAVTGSDWQPVTPASGVPG